MSPDHLPSLEMATRKGGGLVHEQCAFAIFAHCVPGTCVAVLDRKLERVLDHTKRYADPTAWSAFNRLVGPSDHYLNRSEQRRRNGRLQQRPRCRAG